jgi:6-phosphogluconate dehydrogenase (decarboxylating)
LRSFREGLSGRIKQVFGNGSHNPQGDDNLYDFTLAALVERPDLSNFTSSIQYSREGRWIVMAAIEEEVQAEVPSAVLYSGFWPRPYLCREGASPMRYNSVAMSNRRLDNVSGRSAMRTLP